MILDASALLALLQGEPGSDAVARALPSGSMSAVNLSETVTKLIQHGVPTYEARSIVESLDLEILPVDDLVAYEAARLFMATRKYGLSLGDRICLATAIVTEQTVLTADKAWSGIVYQKLTVELIR